MATLSACLNTPWTPEQAQQALAIRGYFAAMSQHNAEQVLSYCTEDVEYYPPAPTRDLPHTRPVRGKADYRAYLQDVCQVLRNLDVEQCGIFPHPTGLAVRSSARWTVADGHRQQFTASLIFRFAGMLMRQSGIHLGDEILAEHLVQRLAMP